jgi:hypothetical protein
MMGLDKVTNTRFASDKGQAQRGAQEQLKIILANKTKLLNTRNGKKLLVVANSFNKSKTAFTPKQLSFIDSIYEKTMQGAGFESFAPTFKSKRKE